MHAFEHFGEVAHAYLVAEPVNIVLYFLAFRLQFPTFRADAYIFIQVPDHPILFYILMWKLYNEIIKLYSSVLLRVGHCRFILRSSQFQSSFG